MDDFRHRQHTLGPGYQSSCAAADAADQHGGQNFLSLDEHDTTRDGIAVYHHGYGDIQDPFADELMDFNSIDERLHRLSEQGSWNLPAAHRSARVFPPSISARAPPCGVEPFYTSPPRYAPYRAVECPSNVPFRDSSTSSPFDQHLPSSPTVSARQRQPRPVEYGRAFQSPLPQPHFTNETLHDGRRELSRVESSNTPSHLAHRLHHEPPHPGRHPLQSATDNHRPNRNPPVVQGIDLVSTHTLPERFRSIFPYPLFNAVQSKCFDTIYHSNNNFVLSSPTGSGKTAVLELAICRLVNGSANSNFKIVYQAPTKSLCAERQRDWEKKFAPLDLKCAELTGDTENAQLHHVQHAQIIITTPEKWDSMTRKWKDHQKLMQMVKLFLIDEVHILKEERGATLEAVVSRMKSVGSDVRFIALSATVPNSQDIAIWLGKDPVEPHAPAVRQRFGEEYRPVRLQKHVCGYQTGPNDFAFGKSLSGKLPEVISKWSQRKPIMVFCFTRASCVETAKVLSKWWSSSAARERYWTSPRKRLIVADKELMDTIATGVAFHHAGLSPEDRAAVESGYLSGEINVICCTSTLAVGVNLPCHMVIIKNTVAYQNPAAGGCKEYSDLEIMQMLGRAGRPQFDDSAVAVIMTRLPRVTHYETMISGQEVLESCLHRNLIDHLNSEIGLGTIVDVPSAKRWLMGTFLYVRLRANPEHYQIEGNAPGRSLDERLEIICRRALALLSENDLVVVSPNLQCTEFGDAMARYYVQFDTMRTFLALPAKAKVSEILSAISQAAEFKDMRIRPGEKASYKALNQNNSIKYPIPVNLDLPAHKVSLVIQSTLGGVELPAEEQKQKFDFNTAKPTIFQHAIRLVRCIVDCKLCLEDSVSTRNALMLARSLGAKVWDDSPLHVTQLDGVGMVTVRKLVSAGIASIDELENAEAHHIERALSRNPPYGTQLQQKARAFPKLRVSLEMMGEPFVRPGEYVTVKLKADVGFMNENVPEKFQRRAVYACLLVETSDDKVLHFARISAKMLKNGQDIPINANLTAPSQSIRAYVMCDGIAGTLRHAVLKLRIPASSFPSPKIAGDRDGRPGDIATTNHARPTKHQPRMAKDSIQTQNDEFGDGDIDDADLARAEVDEYVDIDELDLSGATSAQSKRNQQTADSPDRANASWEPRKLPNGKWACNHACKDKEGCKHYCCREGLDKMPNPPKGKTNRKQLAPTMDAKQKRLGMPTKKLSDAKLKNPPSVQKAAASHQSKEAENLDRLHNNVSTKMPKVPTLGHGRADDRTDTNVLPPKTKQSRLSFASGRKSMMKGLQFDDLDDGLWSSNNLLDVNDYGASSHEVAVASHGIGDDFRASEEEMLDEIEDFDESFAFDQAFSDQGEQDPIDLAHEGHAKIRGTKEFTGYDNGIAKSVQAQTAAGVKDDEQHDPKLFLSEVYDTWETELLDTFTSGTQKRSAQTDSSEAGVGIVSRSKRQKREVLQPATDAKSQPDLLDSVTPFAVSASAAPDTSAEVIAPGEAATPPDDLGRWFEETFGSRLFELTN